MKFRIHMYPHAGCGNRGCEAIVKSTVSLLQGQEIYLYSHGVKQDQTAGIPQMGVKLVEVGLRPVSIKRVLSAFHSRVLHDKLYHVEQSFPPLYQQSFSEQDICFSIGGDNYCYQNMVEKMSRVDQLLYENGARHFVLWGCSIEPVLFEDHKLLEDLNRFDYLVARESITLDAMKASGLEEKAILVPDPAFILPSVEKLFPKGLKPGNTVGINLSPLVIKRGKSPQTVFAGYQKLIQEILQKTDMGVLLIPHVMWSHEDDRKPLGELYRQFSQTGRVAMIEDGNAMELKGYIRRCKFFVGSRTHSTIAAYSTGVPTLVSGYSVKARGIARDLFGTEQSYVLPVQQMTQPEELSRAFWMLVEREAAVREQLLKVTADYPVRIHSAMKQILKGFESNAIEKYSK